MRLALTRFLLSPVASWRAARAAARSSGDLSFDTAWRRERVARHPDEVIYQQYGHQPPTLPGGERDTGTAAGEQVPKPGPAQET
ncbi:hypothetical protein [Streptomyces sp. NBC_00859]|uniref:hypothetical protein n=1 Tax=Streptomyces sp. NBC_00859 TaxID=2903682 RepID=UPI00386878C7|nr:hypothetical protein OG584_00110 [Streptomyces sp. NBC_00859]WSZ86775.1 hypothetical protein OG584_35030 [Streptomyces sp. NBC_00859]